MQKKYIYILLSFIILALTIVFISYLNTPTYRVVDTDTDVKTKIAVDSNKRVIKQYTDTVNTLYDSVNYYKMRIEANELKLKRLQNKKYEAPKVYIADDWFVNDYTKFFAERYK